MAKKKPVPAMYPKPEVKIADPQKIVAIDVKKKTIVFAGSPPPDLAAVMEAEIRRVNLQARLTGYTQSCLLRITPHFGERPKYISVAKWKDVEQRVRLIRELPVDAPAEAHDALRALQTLNRLVDELVKAGDYPDAVERAICWAIDLGQLLQRGQTQIDHGEAVDVGRRNITIRSNNNVKQSAKKSRRNHLAETEYSRRISAGGKQTATLKNMSRVTDENGNRVYGSFGSLKRDIKHWKSLNPPE